MGIKQIALAAIAFVLLITFFLFGKTKDTKKVAEAKAETAQEEEVFDIQQYLKQAQENLKSKDTLALIRQAIERYDNISDKSERDTKQAAAKKIADLMGAAGDPLGSAYYFNKAAELANTATLWHESGENFFELTGHISAPTTRTYLYDAAIDAFKNASDLEPEKLSHQIKLGEVYIEQGTNPMHGVSLLLEAAKQDSTNLEAQFSLGKFSLVSGQYEKAIIRLEKVLSSQPQNTEVLFLLAEAHRNLGNISKAVEYLELCKRYIDNDALKKEIGRYIEETKNIK